MRAVRKKSFFEFLQFSSLRLEFWRLHLAFFRGRIIARVGLGHDLVLAFTVLEIKFNFSSCAPYLHYQAMSCEEIVRSWSFCYDQGRSHTPLC